MTASELLKEGSRELGTPLTGGQEELFLLYLAQLKLWNKSINLTAVKTDREIVIKHFLDSITAEALIPEGASVLDIGTGAGFPGVPLKIVRPDLDVTLLDSSGKKVSFLKDLIRKLGLSGITALSARAEEPENGLPRESFDCVITRAVGSVTHVLDLSRPYVKEGGGIILMRGRNSTSDIQESEYPEGLELVEEKHLTLPFGEQERTLLLFKRRTC